jgi:dihydrofolate reductase
MLMPQLALLRRCPGVRSRIPPRSRPASSVRTQIETVFNPDGMKATAERDITVGGPSLAAHAIKAGLVDEYHLFLNPIAVGGGTSYFPHDARVELELLDERRFRNGVVFLRYRRRTT